MTWLRGSGIPGPGSAAHPDLKVGVAVGLPEDGATYTVRLNTLKNSARTENDMASRIRNTRPRLSCSSRSERGSGGRAPRRRSYVYRTVEHVEEFGAYRE